MIIKSKNKTHPIKNLQQLTIPIGKYSQKKIWFFLSSLYQIAIIDTTCPYPYTRISSQNHIQYFSCLSCVRQGIYYLLVVNSQGVWGAYLVKYANNIIQVCFMCSSVLKDVDNKVIGCHFIEQDSLKVIFVKGNGKLEYNYLNKQIKSSRTMKINKGYEIETEDDKYQKTNLFSKYQGNELLQIFNENNIIDSAFKMNTKELLVVIQDINSGISSILRIFIQNYDVMAGMDLLLNLSSRPLQIIPLAKLVIINLGLTIFVWAKNLTQQIPFVEDGMFCTNLSIIDEEKQNFIGCFIKNNESHIFLFTLNLQAKDQNNLVNFKFQKIVKIPISQIILNYSPLQLTSGQPAIGLNSKLEIVYWEKDGKSKIILPNMQATIISATLFQQKYSSYIKAVKKVGLSVEAKIITNNRIVIQVDEYQHNMLINMANCLKYCINGDKAEFYLSSPIIGTLKIAASVSQNQKTNSPTKLSNERQSCIAISTGSMEPNLITEQQSLYLEFTGNQQITPTKLITTKSKFSISQLFEKSVDSILAGCIVGGYALLLVEKQVHIFIIDPKPKRLHIYCFDHQVKSVIALNGVNLWGAMFWNGSFHVFRIHEKESVKIMEIQDIQCYGLHNSFTFNISMNTAPHTFTIIGTHLLMCSNDPLHVYQPQKTIIKSTKLNCQKFGQSYYPVIDLSQGKVTNQKYYTILSNGGSRWFFVHFMVKYLVKNIQDICVQVQQILAFPTMNNLIGVVLKDQILMAICTNRIIILSLYLGNLTYKSSDSKPKLEGGLNHLKRWLKRQEIQYGGIILQNSTNIWETEPKIIKMSENRVLVYDKKQVWYASLSDKSIKLISYFSMPNNAFFQFRNNLGVHELQNREFMKIFAEKLPILGVQKITEMLFAVLFQKMVTVVEIQRNEGLVIKQTLPFSECHGLISINQFIGVYDEFSIYMKDCAHRLVLLKYNCQTDRHSYELKQVLDDEIVTINRVKGWRERTRKVNIMENQLNQFEELRIKRDGYLMIGKQEKPIYI